MLFSYQATIDIQVGDAANEYAASVLACIWVTRGEDAAAPDFINAFNVTHDFLWYREHFLWHYASGAFGFGAINPTGQGGPQQGQYDIRAKRKMPEGHGLAMQIWNQDTNIGGNWAADLISITYFTAGRILYADH